MSENNTNDRISENQYFDLITQANRYIKQVSPGLFDDLVCSPDLHTIKVIHSLKNFLKAKNNTDAITFLRSSNSDDLKKELGYGYGYSPTFSFSKFKTLLETIVSMKRQQEKLSPDVLDSFAKYEQLVLDMDTQQRKSQENLTELLEFNRRTLIIAKDKARFTARESKKSFENARKEIDKQLERHEKLNVDKLYRKLYNNPEYGE